MSLFGDTNRVELIGNITDDIEVRYTQSKTAVTEITIATSRDYKDGEEWKKEAQFTNVTLWGALATGTEKWAKKGTRVRVTGRIATQSWNDKNTNEKKCKTLVIADDINILARGKTKEEAQAPKAEQIDNHVNDEPMGPDEFSNTINPDDLPF